MRQHLPDHGLTHAAVLELQGRGNFIPGTLRKPLGAEIVAPRIAQQHLQRADELLRQFRCEGHAHRSRLTLLGYEQRLARFGAQIEAALQTPGEPATHHCEELQAEIADHRRARIGQRQEQASRAEMAVRLIRWLSQPLPTLTAFADLASAYVKELSFVDWARESICRGEDGVSR